jgi:aryl-alcohol dehydrogenase-like predicted oxidoreductase
MQYVLIPNTTLRVSQLCLGTTDLGSLIPTPDAFSLQDEFVALGGNFVDTAHVYANWLPGINSSSEKAIGQWLKARNNRDQVVVSTKGGHPELATMNVSRLSRADIEQDVNESLEYLQTDTIDLFWLHRDDPAIPIGEIVDILNEQVTAGKIRYFGGSNWTVSRLQDAADYAARTGKQAFVANQPMWSLAAPNMDAIPDKTLVGMDQEGIAFHRQTGMAAIPYSSQAHGFFSKMDKAGRSGVSEGDLSVYGSKANWKRLERVREVAHQHHASINDVALAYLVCQPFLTIPIIGSKRAEHLHSSVKALDVRLTADELAFLEAG